MKSEEVLPPGWVWHEENGLPDAMIQWRAVGPRVGAAPIEAYAKFKHEDTPQGCAKKAWMIWEQLSGLTRAQCERALQTNSIEQVREVWEDPQAYVVPTQTLGGSNSRWLVSVYNKDTERTENLHGETYQEALDVALRVGESRQPKPPQRVETWVLRRLPRTTGQLLFRTGVGVTLKWQEDGCVAQVLEFPTQPGYGATVLAALMHFADQLGEETAKLVATPTHLLEDDECDRKSELIAFVDPLNSDLGLPHATHRWLHGTVEKDMFLPFQNTDFDPLPIPSDLVLPPSGECLAWVPVHRDGQPSGPIETLRDALEWFSPD